MLVYVVIVSWIVCGYILMYCWLRRLSGPVFPTQVSGCSHPEVEQVEVGDGILLPREVVAKICTECYERLPAGYSSPHSVIVTNEESVPFPYHRIDLSYWTEESERLATRKEAGTCHE